MKYAMQVSYDGTNFNGWQVQPNARTVQGVLEETAQKIFGQPVKITGSGRTDAGVHAVAQVVHFSVQTNIPAHKIRECFNGNLPADVQVLKSVEAPDGFDCTRGAKRKSYTYSVYVAPCALPLLERYAVRVKEEIDVNKMRRAADMVVGEHDFKAFCAVGSSAKTTVRTVYAVTVTQKPLSVGCVYEITVCGNGFLYNMVRILAGELLAIGCGKSCEGLTLALQTGRRDALSKTMPAKGLRMVGVEYENSPFEE